MDYREPLEVAAGDTSIWTRSFSDYPASDGWVLKYAFRGPAVVNLTATAAGSSHKTTISGATFTLSGTYTVQGYVEKDSERYTVYSGKLKVTPNLAAISSGTYDGRSHAQKVVDAIEAVIEGRASRDQQEMWIDGEKLVRTPVADLLTLRDRYRQELAAQDDKERRRQGRGARRIIRYRM